MCGIAGFWSAGPVAEGDACSWVERMTDTLVHRGPDASGSVFDRDAGVALGHRRLAILDLTSAGSQPMWSHSGRRCIVYNGEVYNAPEIRAELDRAGHRIPWRGTSDTEVVLEAIEALGLTDAVERFRGMFAFALWDREARCLSLVRDRLGIKPLVFARGSFGLIFASELRALYEMPSFRPRLDRSALASFFRYGVVPGDECIVEGVVKPQPGTIVRFTGPRQEGSVERYWCARRVASEGITQPFEGTAHDAVDELERHLRDSVALRMRSDVPFGAFLSGGIDSSTVVALMQQVAGTPVKTFCVGNTASGYDESKEAEAVARHLGCDHHTLFAEPGDELAMVPEAAAHWDEPFADSSQIATLIVSRLARQHVTVSLSGDGGDELFAGYNRHLWAPRLWELASRLPRPVRKALGALKSVRVEDWDKAFRAAGLGDAIRLPGDKLYKVAALAEVTTFDELYGRLRSCWPEPEKVVVGDSSKSREASPLGLDGGLTAQMMLRDMIEYLPDDILTKVDRASMSVSLEARVPLLDHAVVELAWRLPLRWKVNGRTQKWILRQLLSRYVPAALFERPKMGFGVPVGQWLRGPLKSWAEELIDGLRAESILDSSVVEETWGALQAGRGNHDQRLWAVLMFQSWWESNRDRISA